MLDHTPELIPQESEVEEIMEVLLSEFLDDNNLINETLSTSYATEIEVPAYKLNDKVVWGATGMMLAEVREMLLKI